MFQKLPGIERSPRRVEARELLPVDAEHGQTRERAQPVERGNVRGQS